MTASDQEKANELGISTNDFATPTEEERTWAAVSGEGKEISKEMLEIVSGPKTHSRFIAPRDIEWESVPKKAKKICMVGAGPTWRATPWNDPTYEFWGINAFHRMKDPEHYDRWFQIHLPGSGEGHIDDKDHKVFLEKRKWPIYMVRKFEEYPGSLAYPFWQVVDRCCPHQRPYFTNTIDFLVCLAILEAEKPPKTEVIALYGIDFISDIDDEYYKMRQSLEHYLGRAEEIGIRLEIPADSALLKTDRVYGYEPRRRDTAAIIQRLNVLQDKLKADEVKAFDRYNDAKAEFHRHQGACSVIDRARFMIRMRDRGLPF